MSYRKLRTRLTLGSLRPGALGFSGIRRIPGAPRHRSISLNPDAVVRTTRQVLAIEKQGDRTADADMTPVRKSRQTNQPTGAAIAVDERH